MVSRNTCHVGVIDWLVGLFYNNCGSNAHQYRLGELAFNWAVSCGDYLLDIWRLDMVSESVWPGPARARKSAPDRGERFESNASASATNLAYARQTCECFCIPIYARPVLFRRTA